MGERGIDNFSLREVSKELGVSHTAPYKHFKNKEELIRTIAEKALSEFSLRFRKIIAAKGPIHQKITDLGYSYVEFGVENPDLMKVLLLTSKNQKSEFEDFSYIGVSQGVDPLSLLTREITESGGSRYDRHEKLLISCIAYVHGIMSLINEGRVQPKDKWAFIRQSLEDFSSLVLITPKEESHCPQGE